MSRMTLFSPPVAVQTVVRSFYIAQMSLHPLNLKALSPGLLMTNIDFDGGRDGIGRGKVGPPLSSSVCVRQRKSRTDFDLLTAVYDRNSFRQNLQKQKLC